MTALDAYNHWKSEILLCTRGIRPRRTTSIDSIRPDLLPFFERFSAMVGNNAGMVDWRLMVGSLAKFYRGWYHPRLLTSPKGMKIYRTSIMAGHCRTDHDSICEQVHDSMRFIGEYCKSNGMSGFGEYLEDGSAFIPAMLRHYSAGSVSPYFMAAIPDVIEILEGYPQDAKEEFAADFIKEYPRYREGVVGVKRLSVLINRFGRAMDAVIAASGGKEGDDAAEMTPETPATS